MAFQEHHRVHCLGRTLDVFRHEAVYTPTALPVGKDHYDFPEAIAHKALISDKFPGNSLSAITESLSSTVDGTEVGVRMSKDGVLLFKSWKML